MKKPNASLRLLLCLTALLPAPPLVAQAQFSFTTNNGVGGSWMALQSCTLTNGSIYFSDAAWRNYPARFYRLRSP